jgi:hypothetical protein
MRSLREDDVASTMDWFHGKGTQLGSKVEGRASTMVLVKSSMASADVAMGPTTDGMVFWPSIELSMRWYGILPLVGRKPKRPWYAEGLRMEPPRSDPMPSGLPWKPMRAPSPPLDPPQEKVLL